MCVSVGVFLTLKHLARKAHTHTPMHIQAMTVYFENDEKVMRLWL